MPRPQKGKVENLRTVFTQTCDNCRNGGTEKCQYNGGPVWSLEAQPPCKLTCNRWYNKKRGTKPKWELLERIELPLPELAEPAPDTGRTQGWYSYNEEHDGNIQAMIIDLQEYIGAEYPSHVIAYLVKLVHEATAPERNGKSGLLYRWGRIKRTNKEYKHLKDSSQ